MGGSPTAARFDLSGLYLAVGGTESRVVGTKQEWAQLANLSGAIGNKVSTRHQSCTTQLAKDVSVPAGPASLAGSELKMGYFAPCMESAKVRVDLGKACMSVRRSRVVHLCLPLAVPSTV